MPSQKLRPVQKSVPGLHGSNLVMILLRFNKYEWLIILSCQLELSYKFLHVSIDLRKNLLKLIPAHHDFCHLLSNQLKFVDNLYR